MNLITVEDLADQSCQTCSPWGLSMFNIHQILTITDLESSETAKKTFHYSLLHFCMMLRRLRKHSDRNAVLFCTQQNCVQWAFLNFFYLSNFKELHKFAAIILAISGSIYLCKQLYSLEESNKIFQRSRLTIVRNFLQGVIQDSVLYISWPPWVRSRGSEQ